MALDDPKAKLNSPAPAGTARGPVAASPGPGSDDDAFAATIAPTAGQTAPPVGVVRGSIAASRRQDLDVAATLNASRVGANSSMASAEIAAAPTVDPSCYLPDREVARGGMGRIVAAEDRRLSRKVAIKELLTDGEEAQARFRREALITARLQHPSIVPVYEAGRWPSGELFFTMKLVAGRPLDDVIDEAKELPDRIALLARIIPAIDAIAYAHSQRFIHRDLKPGNILLGDFGETVVIDWGLAKDLDSTEQDLDDAQALDLVASATRMPRVNADGTAYPGLRHTRTQDSRPTASTLTMVGAVMGTPAYMAPEQARGEPLDERADVFSLGAMLYHTLAGVPPYKARTATDVIAAAALGHIVPLRDRRRDLPAELVAIVERAMASDPAARYRTAGDLAAELRRYQTGQLVGAHRYTAWQHLRRFVSRHRGAVAVAAIALVTFAGFATYSFQRIVRERDRADAERRVALARKQAAERLVDFVQSDLTAKLEPIGRLDLMGDLGTEVRGYYDSIATAPGGLAVDDATRMGRALRMIGKASGQAGEIDQALVAWQAARARLGDVQPTSPMQVRLLAASLDTDIGNALANQGDNAGATATHQRARAAWVQLLGELPSDKTVLLGAADSHDKLGELTRNASLVDQAFEAFSTARELRERAVKLSPGDQGALYGLSESHLKLASLHQARGETAEALAAYVASARLRETLIETEPTNSTWQHGLVHVNGQLADLYREAGQLDEAVNTYRVSIPIIEGLVQRDPANAEWRRLLGLTYSDLGFTLIDRGDYPTALEQFGIAAKSHAVLIERNPKDTRLQVDLSRIYTRTGDVYLSLGRYAEALEVFLQARSIRSELLKQDASNTVWQRLLAWSHTKLAQAYGQRRQGDDLIRAREALEATLTLREALVAASPNHAIIRNELCSTHATLGKLLANRGQAPAERARGVALLEKALTTATTLVDGDAVNLEWKETQGSAALGLGRYYIEAGDLTKARPYLASAVATATAALAVAPQSAYWAGTQAETWAELADLETAEGRPEVAAALRTQALTLLEPFAKAGRLPAYRRGLYRRLKAGSAP